jgi:hypothetical protein
MQHPAEHLEAFPGLPFPRSHNFPVERDTVTVDLEADIGELLLVRVEV